MDLVQGGQFGPKGGVYLVQRGGLVHWVSGARVDLVQGGKFPCKYEKFENLVREKIGHVAPISAFYMFFFCARVLAVVGGFIKYIYIM